MPPSRSTARPGRHSARRLTSPGRGQTWRRWPDYSGRVGRHRRICRSRPADQVAGRGPGALWALVCAFRPGRTSRNCGRPPPAGRAPRSSTWSRRDGRRRDRDRVPGPVGRVGQRGLGQQRPGVVAPVVGVEAQDEAGRGVGRVDVDQRCHGAGRTSRCTGTPRRGRPGCSRSATGSSGLRPGVRRRRGRRHVGRVDVEVAVGVLVGTWSVRWSGCSTVGVRVRVAVAVGVRCWSPWPGHRWTSALASSQVWVGVAVIVGVSVGVLVGPPPPVAIA